MSAWMPIAGWDGFEVSDAGDVRVVVPRTIGAGVCGTRTIRPGPVRQWVNHRGYKLVTFWRDKRRKHYQVHRLVLSAFVGECPVGMEACHNNGIQTDNRLDNLRWDTRKNNHADKRRHGTWQVGERANGRKLTERQVAEIRFGGGNGIEVGRKYGISKGTVYQIRKWETWKHVKGAA